MFYTSLFFIVGLIFGSFFNVIGLRLPKGESFINSRSRCPKCHKQLKWYELIPLISYIIQFGKCRNCKKHISIKYLLFELLTGVLFALSYIVFGFDKNLLIAITFISMLIIVIVSDIEYMVIPDEIILIGSILIIIEVLIFNGFNSFLHSLFNGILSFGLMYLIKIVGDFIFKKESLGGGDIKLMGMIGLLFNIQTMVVIIFFASFFALPYAIAVLLMKKDPIVPYGPFISLTATSLFLLQLNNISLFDLVNYIV